MATLKQLFNKYKTPKRAIQRLIYYRPVRFLIYYSKHFTLPGLQKVPIFSVGKFFVASMRNGALNQRAAATSFHFILALFPLVLTLFTLLPYIPIAHLYQQLYEMLKEVLPTSVYGEVKGILDDIVKRKHNGLMSIGFLSSIYVASSGINAILISFNYSKLIKRNERRKWLKRRMLSVILILLIGLVSIFAFSIIVGFKSFTSYLIRHGILNYGMQLFFLKTLKWVLLIALVYFVFASIYYIAPIRKKGYRFFSIGATIATCLLILTTLGFNFYINNFAHYNVLYGSIGALIVLMLWIYLNNFILLAGFELNASVSEAHADRADFIRTKQTNRLADSRKE
ncbi:MAG: YihY/virulence factor BrkB family protein [Bacteroidales bacterium]|jgi:membrane protein|nr:YihY/virulence factor BrkB family protein [Bacteroidales bacterium]